MSENAFSSLHKRIITGLILIAIVSVAWIMGNVTLFLLACTISGIAQWEFCAMFLGKENKTPAMIAISFGSLIILVTAFVPSVPIYTVTIITILSLLCMAIYRFNVETSMIKMRTYLFIGMSIFYIPLLFAPILTFTPTQQLFIACLPIASDTIAYFTGILFGTRKIWVTVSPKKSVEGSLGGLCASVALTVFFGLFIQGIGTTSLFILIPMGIFLGIMAQMGDFFESAIKRSTNIKDSGTILPGHGGILDRIDSLIFAIPTYAICLELINIAN